MIQIYFINLTDSTERRVWFESQVKGFGLTARRVEAINGFELSNHELRRYRSFQLSAHSMGPAEIGCYLSHRKVWEIIRDADDPWAFVAEDDLLLANNCQQFFKNFNWIPVCADLVKAETALNRCHRDPRVATIHAGCNVRKLLSWHGRAGGYFVSKSTAQILVQDAKGICEPADHFLFDPHIGIFDKLNVYQIEPAFGLQYRYSQALMSGFESTISINSKCKTRPKGYPLFQREAVRSFHRLRRGLKNKLYSLRHGTLYSAVPFYSNNSSR